VAKGVERNNDNMDEREEGMGLTLRCPQAHSKTLARSQVGVVCRNEMLCDFFRGPQPNS
jgi:hypothetical protein